MPLTNRGLDTQIFRITHYRNLDFTLRNGIFSHNSEDGDPNYINIGNQQLINDRGGTIVRVAPNGTLNDYVPFYFAPRSPMLYSISQGNVTGFNGDQSDIAYIVSNIGAIQEAERPYIFTNAHAYIALSRQYNNIRNLDRIDWNLMNARYWNRTIDDPDRMSRRMAEFLIYQFVPTTCILEVVIFNEQKLNYVNQLFTELNLNIPARICRDWYF
ncbi:MAG: DUF4433 domain-containing protein [Ignavibacteriaceae bacterium]|nr:DUF4433 domain-containing protein [Ignavibacterium sp.]MCC6253758.1 DUF4433 domain-containing protein [Ignavibacteriaceae bacterium]HRN27490.1 DUF4433 domain-containing protein [Ignavibacteriaceae bacterium]HRP91680.1 DUF4433 domain-containing protein [Ignavibacteriaceae bacterium]HRQ55570.1 DUF4433 domain-containing protein [Ignavibacteriaceae bacterium]